MSGHSLREVKSLKGIVQGVERGDFFVSDRPKEIFVLGKIVDRPVYEGFGLDEAPSLIGRSNLLEDITPGYGTSDKIRVSKPVFLGEVWKPPRVSGNVASFNDFPGLNLFLPVFSERACECLQDFLEPNGELLELDTDCGEYFFYNVTRFIDALNAEQSICEFWCDPPTTAVCIDHFSFEVERLENSSVFRIHEDPSLTLVSNSFVQRVEEYGLNGFEFRKVWPLEKNGPNWRLRHKELKKSRTQPGEAYFKRNTLVVVLALQHVKANAHEKRRIREAEAELNAQLLPSSPGAPWFGRLEGCEIVGRECRIIIGCPDVDALVSKLYPWLKALAQKEELGIRKRYGDAYDPEVVEEWQEI